MADGLSRRERVVIQKRHPLKGSEATAHEIERTQLLHGDADSIVPVTHSRKLAAAADGRARLIEFPGGDHNTLRDSHPEIERIVIDFLHANLREQARAAR